MRLDLLLKQTGIIKRRIVAKNLAETGHILINNKTAKPSSEVKENDIILLKLGSRELSVKINYVVKGKKSVPEFVQL